tara:strand:- start:382 stop:600 length:219 start_codon:yes stop_codon:yes gene_type:complete
MYAWYVSSSFLIVLKVCAAEANWAHCDVFFIVYISFYAGTAKQRPPYAIAAIMMPVAREMIKFFIMYVSIGL